MGVLSLLCAGTAEANEGASGLQSLKIYHEPSQCLFLTPDPGEYKKCPVPTPPRTPQTGGEDTTPLDDLEVTGMKVDVASALLSPLIDAGIKTFAGVLKAAGSDSSVSKAQGTTILVDESPKCLLIVHAQFATSNIGQSLTSYLASRNNVAAISNDERCSYNGEDYVTACVKQTNGVAGCEVSKDRALHNPGLADAIHIVGPPSFVIELRVDDYTFPGFVRFSPTYVEYASTMAKRGKGAKRDLVLLAKASSSSASSPFPRNQEAEAGAEVLFDWTAARTGAAVWNGAYEPWSQLIRYTSDDSQILEGAYGLWFALVETKRGSRFLKELGSSLSDDATQAKISALAQELATGVYGADGAKARADAAKAMKDLAAARRTLWGKAEEYCSDERSDSASFDVEQDFYDYQAAYASADQAMRAIGHRVDGDQYPKPGSNFHDRWADQFLCSY